MSGTLLLFLVSLFLLIIPAVQASTLTAGKVEINQGLLSLHASAVLTDGKRESGYTQCDSRSQLHLISSNEFFKGMPLGTSVNIRFPVEYAGGHRSFFVVQASLVNRDYFSNMAILKPAAGAFNSITGNGHSLQCVGMQSKGIANEVHGFTYYSLKDISYGSNTQDRGLSGALAKNGHSPVGIYAQPYISPENSDHGHTVYTFASGFAFYNRVMKLGRKAESRVGMLLYSPHDEAFIADGAHNPFVLAPMPNTRTTQFGLPGNGHTVEILGAPEDPHLLLGSPLKRSYRARRRLNPFYNISAKLSFDTLSEGPWAMVLKKIDNQIVRGWNHADTLLRQRDNQHKAIIEFDVHLGQEVISFIYGHKTAQDLSNGRYVAKKSYDMGALIFDDDEPALKGEEKQAMSSAARGLTDLFNRYRNHLNRPDFRGDSQQVTTHYKPLRQALRRAKQLAFQFNDTLNMEVTKYGGQTWQHIYSALMTMEKQIAIDWQADHILSGVSDTPPSGGKGGQPPASEFGAPSTLQNRGGTQRPPPTQIQRPAERLRIENPPTRMQQGGQLPSRGSDSWKEPRPAERLRRESPPTEVQQQQNPSSWNTDSWKNP